MKQLGDLEKEALNVVKEAIVDIPEPLITTFRNSVPLVLQNFDHINSLINNCHF